MSVQLVGAASNFIKSRRRAATLGRHCGAVSAKRSCSRIVQVDLRLNVGNGRHSSSAYSRVCKLNDGIDKQSFVWYRFFYTLIQSLRNASLN